jgi:hypothetical protein
MADNAGLPVPSPALDRAAVERVLARAAELQLAGAGGEAGLSEADLVAAAREAGIAPDHVRAALAEERLRAARAGTSPAASERGFAARVAGPAVVGAERLVAGPAARAVDALGAWLEREECMRLVRRTGAAGPLGAAPHAGLLAEWEPRRDVLGNLARGLRGGGTAALRRVPLVRAVALPAGGGADGDERVLVRVEADLAPQRRQRLAAGVALAGGGAAAGGAVIAGAAIVAKGLLLLAAPAAAVPLLAGGAAAWALGRGQRDAAERAREALERLLDRAEGPALAPPPAARAAALLDALDGVRRALR